MTMRHSSSKFPDNFIDALIEAYRSGGSSKARATARTIGKEEYIFGLLPSDFLYYLPFNERSKVLNIACELGTHSFNIAKLVGEVHACDISLKNIAFCQERMKDEGAKNVYFLHSDIVNLPFSSDTFDVIIINDVAGSSGKTEEDVRRVYQLLKPGGVLYLGMYARRTKEIRRMLSGAGFKDIDLYIAHPNHYFPRFLIPFDELYSLRFVMNIITDDKGVIGRGIRALIKISLVVKGIRFFLSYYAVFAKK